MPGIGPRVGGAHVDVDLKFDDNSVNTVGKQIHKQLAKLGNNLAKVGERNREIYQSIGRDSVVAWRALLGAIVAGAPHIGSLLSGIAGAATLVASALYSAAQAGAAFLPILTSLGVAGATAYLGFSDFFKAIKKGDFSKLPPQTKAAAKAVKGLNDEFQHLRDVVQERMFKGLADDITKLGTTLFPVLERGLGKTADALNLLLQGILDYVNSKSGLKTISAFLDNQAKIFRRLSKFVVPFLDGFLKLMNALAPSAKRMADRITTIAQQFQDWASAPGFAKRINDQMKRAEKTAGLLIDVLVNVWKALQNVFGAANPATNEFLTMLGDVTKKFLEWTGSVEGQNAIAEWAGNAVDIMRQFGKTAEAIFKVIAELADPRVIINFLETVEGAFDLLGKLPLDKIVEAFIQVSEALQPVSKLFLAIVIAGAAVNILIGSLIGQVGGVVAMFVRFMIFRKVIKALRDGGGAAGEATKKTGLLGRAWEFLVRIFNKVKSAIGKVVGFFTKTGKATDDVVSKAGKFKGAFSPVLRILGRFAKFAGPVGLAVWIGSIIARSDKLKDKFGKLWDAIKEVGSALKDAFEEIANSLKPLAPAAEAVGSAIGFVFDILDKIAEIGIGLVLDTIIFAFKSLAKVIEGVGDIVSGFIDVLIGLFTLDFDKVWEGLKKMGKGLIPLLQGLAGLFLTFFAPARLARIGFGLMKGLLGGITKAIPGVLAFVGKFIVNVLKWFAELIPKLLAFGLKAFGSLAEAVVKAAPGVLAKIGKLVLDVIVWFAKLPVRLLQLGTKAIQKLGQAIIKGAPKVIKAAANIFQAVAGWIGRLPGRLLALGRQAISKLGGAVSAGISKLKGIAAKIFQGVVSWIEKLPERLFSLGSKTITRLANAVQTGVGKLKKIAGDIKDSVLNAIKSLPGEIYNIGKNIIGSLISGLESQFARLKDLAGKIGGIIKDAFPGSPVKAGPLKAWNYGGGASGGGRAVIDAIAEGLKNTKPIKRAMNDVANSIGSITPAAPAASATPTRVVERVRDGGGAVQESPVAIHLTTMNGPSTDEVVNALVFKVRGVQRLGRYSSATG